MKNKTLSIAAIVLAVASIALTASTGAYAKNGKNTHEHDAGYEDNHSNTTGKGHENHQGNGYGHHKGACTDGDLNTNGLGLGHSKNKGKGHENHQGNGYGHEKFSHDGNCGGSDDNDGNDGSGIGSCVATTLMSYDLDQDGSGFIQYPYYYIDADSTDPLPLFPSQHSIDAYSSLSVSPDKTSVLANFYAPEGNNVTNIEINLNGQTVSWDSETGFTAGGENVQVLSSTYQKVTFFISGMSGTGSIDFQITICAEDGEEIDPS